jgi:hypothetical protein
MTGTSGTADLQRRVVGLSLIAAPALLLLADLIDVHGDGLSRICSQSRAPHGLGARRAFGLRLARAGDRRSRHLLRPKRPLLARLGGSLAIVGVGGLAAQRGIHLVFVEMVGDGIKRAPMQALFDRVYGSIAIAVIVACAIAGTYLSQLLLTIGLWRARIAPI